MSTDSQPVDAFAKTKYEETAKKAYDNIASFFSKRKVDKKGNFWQLGCTFDSALDYLRYTHKNDSVFIFDALDLFNSLIKTNSACWYDDFGWWGIAATKAYDPSYSFVFGEAANDFRKIAVQCWYIMHNGKDDQLHFGGPNVWANRCLGEPDKNYFNNPQEPKNWAVPRFEKGVWQYDIFSQLRANECNDYSNPSDPTKINLGPFQNTVMNGLYWVLALRLFNKDTSVTSQAIQDEYDFLSNWFFLPNEPDNALLDVFTFQNKPAALVRERVSTYAWCEAIQSYPPVNCYHKDAFWTGDQGLIMGALIDYNGLKGDSRTLEIAQDILRGVAGKLVKNNQLQAHSDDWPAGDEPDYCSGIGVFQRYLFYSSQNNTGINNMLKEVTFQNILKGTADASCTKPLDPDSLFNNFNCIASLISALNLLAFAE